MESEKRHAKREYNYGFVLDESKLTRIHGIMQKRVESPGLDLHKRIAVQLKNSTKLQIKDREELLSLDNAISNPIVKLYMSFASREEGSYAPAREISVEFDSESSYRTIEYTAHGPTAWVQDSAAELEEQIERTLEKGWIIRLKRAGEFAILAALIILILGIATVGISSSIESPDEAVANKYGLDLNEVLILRNEIKNVKDASDMAHYQFMRDSLIFSEANVRSAGATHDVRWSWGTMDLYFVLLPIVIILAVVFYLVVYCYPSFVFAWGDIRGQHDRILSKRKFLWNLVVVSIVVGVLVNLTSTHLSQLLSR